MNRLQFRLCYLISFWLVFFIVLSAVAAAADNYFMYVGTYTLEGSTSKGIYVYRYDAKTGKTTSLGLAAETTNPSFLAVHPNHRFLYAVNEIGNYQGKKSGGVSAFAVDRATGKLKLLNEVASGGADPCYITVDKTGKYVLVANYTGGSVAAFPIGEDGSLGEASAFVQHSGHGTNPERQEGPHAHSIDLSPDNRFAIVDDLGLDQTLVYKFDAAKGSLSLNDPPFATADPGAGPRHFAFDPKGKFAYRINEMGSTISVFEYEATGGQPCQKISRARTTTQKLKWMRLENFSTRQIAGMTALRYLPSTPGMVL
jgi:6-phosphogluconolactonase